MDDYVLRYLKNIREPNFSIVFISASRLAAASIGRLREHCCDVIAREDAGRDFGSWSAGFAAHGADISGRLLLANDSVYGPIGSLRTALDRLTRKPADFYGMVESVEIAPTCKAGSCYWSRGSSAMLSSGQSWRSRFPQ